ncbi:hypothetical protein AB5I41_26520 [Sphingomonas sp. MMS24-JH45]
MGAENVAKTKEAYGWPTDQDFYVPDGVREGFEGAVRGRGEKARAEWEALFARYHQEFPAEAAELDHIFADTLPEGWDSEIPTFDADEKGVASRDAGGKVLNAIAKKVPWLLGGSADLAPSTKTDIKDAGSFEASNYAGANFHFGITTSAWARW